MSVAIRAITRIQDADDVNVTPAVGVDEYALVYDHDTARFVLRAPAAAPDLSGYALLAGRAGGQTLYGGTAANDDITIHGTSDATRTTSYVLLQPSGGYVGIGTASPVSELHVVATTFPRGVFSSSNGLGWLGFFASEAFGPALYSQAGVPFRIGTATSNLGITGWNETFRVQSTGEVGIGTTTPGARIDLGTVLQGADTPFRYLRGYSPTSNWPIALSAIYDATSGDQYITLNGWMDGGTKASPTFFGSPRGGSFIRDFRGVSFDGLEIGFYPSGTGQSAIRAITIGSTGTASIVSTTATTNALRNVLTLGANVTDAGVGAVGLGPAVLFQAESTTTVDTTQAAIEASWIVATHATRTSRLALKAYDTAAREGIRIDASGTAALLGFYGHAAAAQPAAYTPSNVSADRAFDADTVLVAELADVVGTLIADLQSIGLLA